MATEDDQTSGAVAAARSPRAASAAVVVAATALVAEAPAVAVATALERARRAEARDTSKTAPPTSLRKPIPDRLGSRVTEVGEAMAPESRDWEAAAAKEVETWVGEEAAAVATAAAGAVGQRLQSRAAR